MEYSINQYHAVRNKIWDDLVSSGVTSDEDENFKAFDSVLGNHLAVDWETQSWDEDVEALTGIRQKVEALKEALEINVDADWLENNPADEFETLSEWAGDIITDLENSN